jgi:hypothetical protein
MDHSIPNPVMQVTNPAPPSPEPSSQKWLSDVKKFAAEDPLAASAAAFGAGLVISALPLRTILGSAAAIGATLLRPTLLSLGVIKGLELCCKKTSR